MKLISSNTIGCYTTKKSNTYPPIGIINEFLMRGIDKHGMSGGMEWEPFEISETKYREYIESINGVIVQKSEIPADIEKIEHWYLYKHEINYEVPYAEHRNYWNQLQAIKSEMDSARKSGNKEREMELHYEYIEIGDQSSQFFMKHCKR